MTDFCRIAQQSRFFFDLFGNLFDNFLCSATVGAVQFWKVKIVAQLIPFPTDLSVLPIRSYAPHVSEMRARVHAKFKIDRDIIDASSIVRLIPGVITAFAGYTHGTEFAMADGPNVAVEDLEPGMELRAPDGEITSLLWIGSVELSPAMLAHIGGPDAPALVRILPDRFGYARPARDIVVAGDARINTGTTVKPANTMIDFDGVLPVTPPGPVRMFQLVCVRPTDLIANGMVMPSFSLSNWLSKQNPLVQDILADVLPGGPTSNEVA